MGHVTRRNQVAGRPIATPTTTSGPRRSRRRWRRSGRSPSPRATCTGGMWIDPDAGRETFQEYAERWRQLQTHRSVRPTPGAREQVAIRLSVYVDSFVHVSLD